MAFQPITISKTKSEPISGPRVTARLLALGDVTLRINHALSKLTGFRPATKVVFFVGRDEDAGSLAIVADDGGIPLDKKGGLKTSDATNLRIDPKPLAGFFDRLPDDKKSAALAIREVKRGRLVVSLPL